MVLPFIVLWLCSSAEQVEFELDSTMTLGWELKGPDIHFTFTCPYGWCGIAFDNSLVKADLIIVQYSKGGVPKVWDMWSDFPTVLPSHDEDVSGVNDATLLLKTDFTDKFQVKFARPLKPVDPADFPIEVGIPFEFLWTYVSGAIAVGKYSELHVGVLTVGYTQAESRFKTIWDNENFQRYGLIMTVLWAVLAPLGAIVGRYFKWWKWWYTAHLIIYGIVIVLTVISANLVILIVENVYTELSPNTVYHSRMGFTIASLVVGQGLLGLIVRYFQRYLTHIPILTHLRLLHRVLGWSMLCIGLANVYLGWTIHDSSQMIIVVPYLSLITAIFLLLEFRHRASNLWPTLNLTAVKTQEMTHLEALELIEDGAELGFYDGFVLDLNAFKFTHPGGKIMIAGSIGEDVGKYLIGTNSLGTPFKGYSHSKQAFDMVTHLAIAKIPFPERILIPDPANYEYLDFILTSKELIAEKTFLITLAHPVHKLNLSVLQISWIGKHVKVAANIDNVPVTRYYSLFFSDIMGWKQEMGLESEQLGTLEREPGSVQIVYKSHQAGTMTKHFAAMELGSTLKMSLPYGPGLCVQSLRGHYVAFSAGTGLVPLLDLMYYMWTHQDSLEFSFTLWSRCRTAKEYFTDDIMNHLAEALPEHFRVVYCNSEDAGDTKESVSLVKAENPAKIWVCGPSNFNKFILEALSAEPTYPKKDVVIF